MVQVGKGAAQEENVQHWPLHFALRLCRDAGASSLTFCTAAVHAGYTFSMNTKLHNTTQKSGYCETSLPELLVEFAESTVSCFRFTACVAKHLPFCWSGI